MTAGADIGIVKARLARRILFLAFAAEYTRNLSDSGVGSCSDVLAVIHRRVNPEPALGHEGSQGFDSVIFRHERLRATS